MIIDGILSVFQLIVNVLLSPLEVINIVIDVVGSIPVVANFLSIIAYVLPWSNILPIIFLTIIVINFKNAIGLIRAIWGLLPFA